MVMTDAERRRILAEARQTLETPVEAYVPPAEPLLVRKRHDPPPEERERPRMTEGEMRRQRQAAAAQHSDSWNRWLDARLEERLTAERATICEIIAGSLAEVVGRAVEKERGNFYAQVRELKEQTIKLETALEHLRGLLALEQSRTLDLPALPTRREIN